MNKDSKTYTIIGHSEKNITMKLTMIKIFAFVFFVCSVSGFSESDSVLSYIEAAKASPSPQSLMVDLTLIEGAAANGAGIFLLSFLLNFLLFFFLLHASNNFYVSFLH